MSRFVLSSQVESSSSLSVSGPRGSAMLMTCTISYADIIVTTYVGRTDEGELLPRSQRTHDSTDVDVEIDLNLEIDLDLNVTRASSTSSSSTMS
jgi:hypothetical protein